jgi:nitroreductase
MNETMKCIESRRSIRKYAARQISETELQAILEAGILAPTAKNQQKWHFTVIQKKELIDKMARITKENVMRSDDEHLKQRSSLPGAHTFHHAPTVIMMTADEKAGYAELDCGAATENMVLAAESLGIGSCFIGSSRYLFKSPDGLALMKQLGIPAGYRHVCCLTLGYRGDVILESRQRNKDVVNYVR